MLINKYSVYACICYSSSPRRQLPMAMRSLDHVAIDLAFMHVVNGLLRVLYR